MVFDVVPDPVGRRRSLKEALLAHRSSVVSEGPSPAVAEAYAVASVSSFFDPADLVGRLPREGAHDAMGRLERDCLRTVRHEHPEWLLSGKQRRASLSGLAAAGTLKRYVMQGRVGVDDALSRALRDYVEGHAKSLDEQDADELVASGQAVAWLAGLVPGLPDLGKVRAALGRNELLAPLREIAGSTSYFSGRHAELDRLRRFVGIIEADGTVERLFEHFRGRLRRSNVFVLSVSGVGGVGKSSLLAKFVLDHARFDGQWQVPFAYLDFDRASLAPDDAGGLVLEMLRQLSCQYPDHAETVDRTARTLRQSYLARASDAREESVAQSPAEAEGMRGPEPRTGLLVASLVDLLRSMDLLGKPYLVVLDTFEEAEYRSLIGMPVLNDLLRRLWQAHPHLRVVISGRSVPKDVEVHERLAVGALDQASSVNYLRRRGMDANMASEVARLVGGLPLVLKLAVDVLNFGIVDSPADLRGDFRGWFGRRLDERRVVAQLYGRILEHIHDPRLRALAHPGLIVRRITPGVLRHVIGPAAGEVLSVEEAERLYHELRREVALVVDEGTHLRHRQDVRAEMLRLMSESKRGEVERAHRLAATYWGERHIRSPDVQDLADQIYHLSMLDEELPKVDARWLGGLSRSLRSSVDDLPIGAAAKVRLLLDGAARSVEGDIMDSEKVARTLLEASALLRNEDFPRVLAILDKLPADQQIGVEVCLMRAETLDRLLLWTEASSVLDRALTVVRDEGRLIRKRADLGFRLGEYARSRELALSVEGAEDSPAGRLELVLVALACSRCLRDRASTVILVERALKIVSHFDEQASRANPHLLRRLALLGGSDKPSAVEPFLKSMGTANLTVPETSLLARALADWDVNLSRRKGIVPGLLGTGAGLTPIRGQDPLLAWTRNLDSMPRQETARLLTRLLDLHSLGAEDVDAFLTLVRLRQPEWRAMVSRAIVASFPTLAGLRELTHDLAGMPRDRVSSVDSVPALASELVRWADSEGAMARLLDLAYAHAPNQALATVRSGFGRWLDACEPAIPQGQVGSAQPEDPGLTPFELVKRYGEAPFVDRMRVGRDLGLLNAEDREASATAMSRIVLIRAKERGLLAELVRRLGLADH